MELLHRICVAAHVVISFEPMRGIRGVGGFLELSGWSAFVGIPYGVQHPVAAQREAEIVGYGEQMKARLGTELPQRRVTVRNFGQSAISRSMEMAQRLCWHTLSNKNL